MHGLGFSHDEIAAEVARRYRVRLREAYRLAWGWTLEHAAERFNRHAAREVDDLDARASLTGPVLREYEKWPDSMRKPVSVLLLLAEIYQTDVLHLLDLADHESLPRHERLVLLRRPRTGSPFGEKLVALMEARGLSQREVAQRASCSAGYLSNVIHGRKRASERLAASLDDLLEAAGELTALAGTQEIARDGKPARRVNPRGQARDIQAVQGEGQTLSLPYVPGRLVIEVSGPAAGTGLLAADSEDQEALGGRLTLVRDRRPSASARTEVTGGCR
jgi:transcriptional regulator with XRE-family HTH domain